MSSLKEVKAFQKRERAKRKVVRTIQRTDTMDPPVAPLTRAVGALLLAYAKSDPSFGDGGSVDWDDLDAAFALAKQAMPGHYEALVRQIKKGARP